MMIASVMGIFGLLIWLAFLLVPIALCAALLGNLAGAALRRYRRG